MKQFFRSLLLFCCLLLLVGPSLASTIVHKAFHSDTLGRSYAYNVYLPDDYAAANLVYPVLYLLHGSEGNENDWPVKGKLQATVDRLVEKGEVPPTIIIIPGSNSWWVDGHNEAAKTAFFQDLVPHVEQTYRVIPDRAGRLVAGHSAGGWGALNFVLDYPDLFAAAGILSPAAYLPYPPPSSSAHTHPAFRDAGGEFDQALWRRLNYTVHIESYKQQDTVVPMFIITGDHDTFDIAYHAAVLYQTLRQHQPTRVELRVVDGGHEWDVWASSLPATLTYIYRHASHPRAVSDGQ